MQYYDEVSGKNKDASLLQTFIEQHHVGLIFLICIIGVVALLTIATMISKHTVNYKILVPSIITILLCVVSGMYVNNTHQNVDKAHNLWKQMERNQ